MFKKTCFIVLSVLLTLLVFFHPHVAFTQEKNEFTIAILDLEANSVSQSDARALSERIRSRISWVVNSQLYKTNSSTEQYIIVERTQMNKVFEQFDVQNTGCVSDECAIEFGRMLQSNRIVIGSVSLIGRTYSITTRMIDVETGRTLHTSEMERRGSIDGLLGSTIQDVADELILDCPYEEWENSEYISINGEPKNASVSVNRKNIGNTPIQNVLVPLGNSTIKIKKGGYEDYLDKVRVEKGNPLILNYFLVPKTKKRVFFKSLIIPGSGQRYADFKGKGNLITILQIVTLAGTVGATINTINTQSDYDDAYKVYKKAYNLSGIEQARKEKNDKYDAAVNASMLQGAAIGLALSVYVWNVIDAAIIPLKFDVASPWNSINIEQDVITGYSGISVNMRF